MNESIMEDALLGIVITSPEYFDKVCGYFIQEDVFTQEKARVLWRKLKEMKGNSDPIDLVTVAGNLSKYEIGQGVNPYYVTTCATDTPLKSNAELYAKKIYEKYLR